MKKTILERKLKDLGWWKKREGGNHEVWTNGARSQTIPRHKEIPEVVANRILKRADACYKSPTTNRTH